MNRKQNRFYLYSCLVMNRDIENDDEDVDTEHEKRKRRVRPARPRSRLEAICVSSVFLILAETLRPGLFHIAQGLLSPEAARMWSPSGSGAVPAAHEQHRQERLAEAQRALERLTSRAIEMANHSALLPPKALNPGTRLWRHYKAAATHRMNDCLLGLFFNKHLPILSSLLSGQRNYSRERLKHRIDNLSVLKRGFPLFVRK